MNKTLRGINSYLDDRTKNHNAYPVWSSYLTEYRAGCVEPMEKLEKPLPVEKRVFQDLPDELPQRVLEFVEVFNRVMKRMDTGEITFSKVLSRRQEDGAIDMEWVENYFRVYFAFEKDEDDSVGFVVSDTEREEFLSFSERLKREDYGRIARKSIEFVIEHKRK